MDTVKLTIDGVEVEVERGTTVLEAARKVGVDIPTLCHHPVLGGSGACRVCVCEIEGAKSLIASCICPAANGMVVHTNSPAVRQGRKTVIELLLASHPQNCLSCERNNSCELQRLTARLNIRESRFSRAKDVREKDTSSAAIVRDTSKCILCGRCIKVCKEVQKVGALGLANRGIETVVGPAFGLRLSETKCVSCGQCSAVCPVGAITVKDDTDRVWEMLADKSKYAVVQVAPAVRAALGEEFGMAPGQSVTGKMATALKRLGFRAVFDTQFAADLTIMEEGHELIERMKSGSNLPLITSCSPGWIRFMENFHPDMVDKVSTCKSPQQMFGAVLKTYYASKAGIDPASIVSVSVMPCTAKKFECRRPEMSDSGFQDVDIVLTTRELAKMLKMAGIDLASLPDGDFDSPLGESTGAATIFGVTGGVMEAALRTVYEVLTGSELPNIELAAVRGLEGVKEAEVNIGGTSIRVAVASGLSNADRLLKKVKSGEKRYHFIEIMACPGGCIAGGGQPFSADPSIRQKRAQALYDEDRSKRLRKSHENPAVAQLYSEFLGTPGGHKAHELLHTSYCGEGVTTARVREAS